VFKGKWRLINYININKKQLRNSSCVTIIKTYLFEKDQVYFSTTKKKKKKKKKLKKKKKKKKKKKRFN